MANLPYIARDLIWIASSLDDLSAFPAKVKRTFGFALRQVQNSEPPPIDNTALKGKLAGAVELKIKHDGESYRTVYIAKLKKGVYVLDAFHKKSKSGKKIPKEIKERIEERLKFAKKCDEE